MEHTDLRVAHTIMGTNFFGIEDAIKYFGVKPTKAQLTALAEIPFTEAELQECRDTHVLVAVFPLSILDIERCVDPIFFDSHTYIHYEKMVFVNQCGTAERRLIRKTELPGSLGRVTDERLLLSMEGDEEVVPTAREMVYTIIGHYLKTGERLFETIEVRTADREVSVDDRPRVHVGYFKSEVHGMQIRRGQLRISYWLDDPYVATLGLASSRKHN